MNEIPMTPVESTNVSAVGFDPDRGIIAVKFQSGGTYHYSGCDQKMYDALVTAPSIGRYVNQVLKPMGGVKV